MLLSNEAHVVLIELSCRAVARALLKCRTRDPQMRRR